MDSNQSGFIFGFIVLAFFVYITVKGELPIYAGLLLLSPPAGPPNTATVTNSQTGESQTAQAVSSSAEITQAAAAILGF